MSPFAQIGLGSGETRLSRSLFMTLRQVPVWGFPGILRLNTESKTNPTPHEDLENFQRAVAFLNLSGIARPHRFNGRDPSNRDPSSAEDHEDATRAGRNVHFPDLFPGQVLDRFRLCEPLGEGGFSVVWLAVDEVLGREVALKLLRQTLALDEEVASRFSREGKAAALLNHPGIVAVYGAGVIGDQPYLACELCRGETLESLMSQYGKPVPPATAVAILCRIGEAVGHAHQRFVVHRDLKPSNILVPVQSGETVSLHDCASQLKVADFGMARMVHPVDTRATVDGDIVGTPRYMAPEQAFGSTKTSAQSDIYSLGVILYELLTGTTPFQGTTPLETLVLLRNSTVPKPRNRNREIPKDLEAICLKCLSQDPMERYPTTWELVEDLNAWRSGKAVSVHPISRTMQFARACRAHPVTSGLVATIVFALALAAWQWSTAERHLALSQQQRARADQHLALLSTSVDAIVDEFEALTDSGIDLPEQDTNVLKHLLKIQEAISDDLGEAIGDGDLKRARTYLRIARIQSASGMLMPSEKSFRMAIDLTEDWREGPQSELAETIQLRCDAILGLAKALARLGKNERAILALAQAESTWSVASSECPDADIALTRIDHLMFQSRLHKNLRANDLARKALNEALDTLETVNRSEWDRTEYRRVFSVLIYGARSMHPRWPVAQRFLREGIDVYMTLVENAWLDATSLHEEADFAHALEWHCRELGAPEGEALASAIALACAERLLAKHPEGAIELELGARIHLSRARMLIGNGHDALALPHLERALDLARKAPQSQNRIWLVLTCLSRIGEILLDAGDDDSAKPYLDECVELIEWSQTRAPDTRAVLELEWRLLSQFLDTPDSVVSNQVRERLPALRRQLSWQLWCLDPSYEAYVDRVIKIEWESVTHRP